MRIPSGILSKKNYKITVSYSYLFPYSKIESQINLKSKELPISTYLITSEDFRDLVVNRNDKENDALEKFKRVNPLHINEINKAQEFIERMTFRKEQLQADELDEMVEKILAYEKAEIQKKTN